MTKVLEAKKILIVGSQGLIGRSIVAKLVDSGANVISCDIGSISIPDGSGIDDGDESTVKYMKLDITDENQVDALFQTYQDLDGIINLAYPRNPAYGDDFLDVTFANFTANVSSNLGGTFNLLKYASKSFLSNPRELSIVNFSSIYGVVAPKFEIYKDTDMTMPVEYASIKAGVQHMSKYSVKYIKDSRFRVNCVCPGGVLSGQPENFREAYKKQTLGHGMIEPEDLTGTVLYLLSNLSRFVNGQEIIVDDGFCL